MNRRLSMTLLAVLGAAACLAARAASAEQPATPLELGSPVERAIAQGESQAYTLQLGEGQFVRVLVRQHTYDVAVAVLRPGGDTLAEVDNNQAGWEPADEELLFVGDEAGSYRLVVTPTALAAPRGGYEITVAEVRAATEADRRRVAGERARAAGIAATGKRSYQEAAARFREALPLFRAAGDRLGEARTLIDLGFAVHSLGDFEQTLDQCQAARRIYRELGDREGEAYTLNLVAVAYSRVGDRARELDYYQQSLALYRAAGKEGRQAFMLINIGAVLLRHLRQPERAERALRDGLELARAAQAADLEASALDFLGLLYRQARDYAKAAESHRAALEVARRGDLKYREAMALSRLGAASALLGNSAEAISLHEEALALAQASRGANRTGADAELAVRRSFAEVYALAADYENALKQAQAAAAYAGQERTSVEQVRYFAACVERDRGNLEGALKEITAVLESIESRRSLIAREGARATLLNQRVESYELYVDVLMRLHERDPAAGHAAAALQGVERMRARTLLDLLAEAGVDLNSSVDPGLRERERSLARDLERAARSGAGEAARLGEEYETLRAEIRRRHPGYAALTDTPRAGLPELQRLLDPGTRLLTYALGSQRSYLWVVSATTMDVYRLPARDVVEAAATRLRALLAGRPGAGAAAETRRAAGELAAIVLAPAASVLSAERLLVMADGALQLVPFAALPGPVTGRPLIADHEVVSVPSGSVLAALRTEAVNRAPAPKAVAVLADPVFDARDPRLGKTRVTGASAQASAAASPLDRALREADLQGPSVPRLPFTRREAAAAMALAPPGQGLFALDFEASRATALRDDLGQYRIVHFASHGLLNAEHPELSGVVLSLVDRQGKPQDGFLRLADVYGLRLAADLVVLSGCQTALGKQLRGEGLIGLVRGFMFAGAPRVVASLWKVDDRATAELMRRFYQALLGRSRPTPAAALRAAQLSMSGERRWSAPYYWAGFVIQGEWR
jgi:CHAT domain-containing protein